MVAINKMVGNAEKSSGLELLMAIIIMVTPNKMLNENKKSNKKEGSGRINIDMISKTMAGIPKPDSWIFDISWRMFDSIAFSTCKNLNKNND